MRYFHAPSIAARLDDPLLRPATGLESGCRACEHLVAIGVGERVPYQWQDGAEPQGASVTLLNRVAAGLGVTLDVLTAESPEQAEREVSSGRVDLLIDAELRPQLQAGLDFLEPPLHEAPVVVWVAKDRVFPFQDWDDLGGRRGVRIDNTEWETESDQRADAQLQLSLTAISSRHCRACWQARSITCSMITWRARRWCCVTVGRMKWWC